MKAAIFSLFGRVGALFRGMLSVVRGLLSLLHELIGRVLQLPPFSKISRRFERVWRGKRVEYHFLPYMTSVLRVLGWAVLVIGVLASMLLGVQILKDGLTIGTREWIGVGPGVAVIISGIIVSFLSWLFLLVARELVCLFIHVRNNTGNTASGMTEAAD